MRIVLASLMGTAALALIAEPAAAARPSTPPAASRLECRIALGPGAEGKVRYEVNRNGTRLMVAVEAESDEADEIPVYVDGEEIEVHLDRADPAADFPIGTIVLTADEDDDDADDAAETDELEGALKYESRTRGRSVRPFPVGFPFSEMVAGASVLIDGQPCVLKDRSRGRSRSQRP